MEYNYNIKKKLAYFILPTLEVFNNKKTKLFFQRII